MAYCSKADLIERYGARELAQITDETAGHTPADAEITAACDEASSLIDSYVAARYAVPLSPVPAVVRSWACAIARRLLWKDRATPEGSIVSAYDQALAQARDVARGVSRLPDAAGVEASAASGQIAVATSSQIFSDELLATMPGALE